MVVSAVAMSDIRVLKHIVVRLSAQHRENPPSSANEGESEAGMENLIEYSHVHNIWLQFNLGTQAQRLREAMVSRGENCGL